MYYDDEFYEFLTFFFGFFGVIIFFALVVKLVFYILRSIGLYTLAQNRGMSSPWIAWIPAVWVYSLGAAADDINEKEQGSRTPFRFVLLIGNLVSTILNLISGIMIISVMIDMFRELFWMLEYNYYYYNYEPYLDPYEYMYGSGFAVANLMSSIGSLVALGIYVVTLIVLHRIYKCYKPQSATLWTVLSAIFPFMQSIYLFWIRKYQPQWMQYPPNYPGNYGYGYPGAPPQYPPQYPPQNPAGYPQYQAPPADQPWQQPPDYYDGQNNNQYPPDQQG